MLERTLPEEPYLETPRGILSRGGLIFHTTRADLESFYGEVLERIPLGALIDRAELWLTSHRTMTLWAMIPLLVYVSIPTACAVGLLIFIGWKALAPALGNARVERAIRLFSSVSAQLVGYVIAMSWLGAQERYAPLIAGLTVFAIVRWQLLDYALRPLTQWLHRLLYPLPVADQMLRAVIHAAAIQLNVRLSQFPSIARWMDSGDKS